MLAMCPGEFEHIFNWSSGLNESKYKNSGSKVKE